MNSKLVLSLMVCSVIAMSHTSPFDDNENKLEHVLKDIEVVLEDLKQSPKKEMKQTTGELQELLETEEDTPVQLGLFGDIPTAKPLKQRTNAATQGLEEMLLHATDINAAIAEIEAVGGRVTLELGHDLLVARIPRDVAITQNNFPSASPHIPNSASEGTISNAEAYWQMRADELKPQPEIQQWPDGPPQDSILEDDEPLTLDASALYSPTMTGKIAVAIVTVSGPGKMKMSSSEFANVKSNSMAGLKFWADNAPSSAHLVFAPRNEFVTIDYTDEACREAAKTKGCHWTFGTAALKKMGYKTKHDLVQAVKESTNADSAFIAFFSRYHTYHHGYTYNKGPSWVRYDVTSTSHIYHMRYVFTHEIGHVFYAVDEYGGCNCDKDYGKGTCTAKNGNCIKCTEKRTKCIMGWNKLEICPYTRKQVGWC